MDGMTPVVLCVDADYFYAQVELRDRPALQGQPVAVKQQHIVVTSNYEARALGVSKLMRVQDAYEKCPSLTLFDGSDLAKYRSANEDLEAAIRRFFSRWTTQVVVERQGLDEFFLDVGDLAHSLVRAGDAQHYFKGKVIGDQVDDYDTVTCVLMTASHVLASLRQTIFEETKLTCSGGVGTMRMAAKWAANIQKPNGQTSLLPNGVQERLPSFAVRCVPGIGWKLESQLRDVGVETVGQLRSKYSLSELVKTFGETTGEFLYNASRGVDNSAVTDKGELQHITVEEAARGVRSAHMLRTLLRKLAGQLAPRLAADLVRTGRRPATLTVKYRIAGRGEKERPRRESLPAPLELRVLDGSKISERRVVECLVEIGTRTILSHFREQFELSLVGIGVTRFVSGEKSRGGLLKTGPSSSKRTPASNSTIEQFFGRAGK